MNQRGFAPIIIILGIVLVLGIIGGAYFLSKNSNTALKNNPVITPTPTVTPKTDETANWKTYTNQKYGFSVKYPLTTNLSSENWQYEETTVDNGLGVGFGPLSSKSGGYAWGVWITENGDIENLIKRMGSQFADRKEKRENININGISALLVTVTTDEVKEFKWIAKNVYIQKDNKVYSIDNGAHDTPEFELFYSTFKFIGSNTGTAKYTCPENGYQNCMPILDAEGQKQCSKEALDWKAANCPNFSGAAY